MTTILDRDLDPARTYVVVYERGAWETYSVETVEPVALLPMGGTTTITRVSAAGGAQL